MSRDRAPKRPNELDRTSSDEGWRPVACADVTPVRRYFDLQAGTVWNDVAAELRGFRGTVVDAGCGAQPYRPLIPESATYVGIDFAGASRLFGYTTADTHYYDGETWPLDDGSVDLVLTTETLEHVAEPERYLNEAFRVLRPGGRLFLTVPFAARWHFIPADYWRYTPSALGRLLSGAGFAELEVRARGNALTVACYKAMALCTPFLMPQTRSATGKLLRRLVGVVLVAPFVALAVIGNLSLRGRSGDDCLGYTARAVKPRS